MANVKISETNPLHYLDASTLAALIRTKEISSREVVQAHLDRVASVNPKINAVVTLMGDSALKTADAADRDVADGVPLGPLHGVPFSIKDALDTAGVPTQRGSKSRSEIILWFDKVFVASCELTTSGGTRAPSGSSTPSLWRACGIG